MKRPARRAVAGLVLALAAGALPAADAPGPVSPDAPTPVRAPYYGELLFQFWQQRWFSAIGSLGVSTHFGRLPPHEDDAELLGGGLLLAYGQHDDAAAVFERLAATRPRQRDRAWLELARARHQRGLPDAAEAALARIEAPLPPPQQETRVLLQSQLLLGRGAAAEAAALLQPLSEGPSASPWARYNRAIALLRAGAAEAGVAALETLGREGAADEERRVLRDRANLTLGLAALHEDRAPAARAALQRVRLHAAPSNKALLADGWAAWAQQQPREAMVPWTELAARGGADPAVLEARIAVPYAQAELGARRQAAEGYERAIEDFEREAQALADAVAALREGRALEPLLQAAQSRELGEAPDLEVLPDIPHRAQLVPMLAEHDFQEALRRVLDLRWLGEHLARWQATLAAFDDLLDTRRRVHAERAPRLLALARGDADGAAAAARRRDALAAELARAEAQDDGRALADDAELAMLARLASARATLQRVGEASREIPGAPAAEPDDADAPALAERLRRVEGLLAWRLAATAPERLWQARKALAEADRALAGSAERQRALAQARVDEPARFDVFARRIGELRVRVAGTLPRVAALEQAQRVALQEIAVTALARTQQRLAEVQTQARFALAQLQDGAELVQSARQEVDDGQAR